MISIGDYAQISGNTGAAGLAAQLQSTAEALLPKFDTGYWSLYSLGGDESPLSYHDYVVTLLVSSRTARATRPGATSRRSSSRTRRRRRS